MAERILVTESTGFSSAAAQLLADLGAVRMADIHNRAELIDLSAEATVLWIRLRHRIDSEVLEASPNLRCIVTPTTGLNHIDAEAAAARGATILSLRGETDFLKDVRATAEHTIGLMLGLLRHLPSAASHAAAGGWDRDLFRGRELFGKTIGIVGYGRVGRAVARYCRAFDCTIVATDPGVSVTEVEDGVALIPLGELLRVADIVSIHASYSSASHHFFGSSEIDAMRPGAWLINTARGELLDSEAVLAALWSGRIAGAALDVLEGETAAQPNENPLVSYARDHDNLLLTPHIGGCTVESMEKTERYMAERLREFLQ